MSKVVDEFFDYLNEVNEDLENGFRKERNMSKLLDYITTQPECVEVEHYWEISTHNGDMYFTLNEFEDMTLWMYVGSYRTELTFEEFKQFEGLLDKRWK